MQGLAKKNPLPRGAGWSGWKGILFPLSSYTSILLFIFNHLHLQNNRV